LKSGIKGLARPAPWGRERNQYRLLGLQDIRLKIRFSEKGNWGSVSFFVHLFDFV